MNPGTRVRVIKDVELDWVGRIGVVYKKVDDNYLVWLDTNDQQPWIYAADEIEPFEEDK